LTPLAVPVFTSEPNVIQIGWQYPLSILPFLYGGAALGLSRWVRGKATRFQRALVAFACSVALVVPTFLAVAWYAYFYKPLLTAAVSTPHTRALAAAARLAPAAAPVIGDDPFVAHLCNRRHVWLYNAGPNLGLPERPRAFILDRRRHTFSHLEMITDAAASWGLKPAAISADYAYFAPGGRRPNDELFRLWFGTIEEWQAFAPGGKAVYPDSRAHDGRSLLVPHRMRIDLRSGDIFPPGDYRFVFLLRPADPKSFTHVVIKAKLLGARGRKGPPPTYVTANYDIVPDDGYGYYRVWASSPTPFRLQLEMFTCAPVYFDAVSINSPDFTPDTVTAAARP
jgi:hypothetical protein